MARNKSDKLGSLLNNKLFFGIVLEKMRKVLVIRTPYVFHNKTKLTWQLRIMDNTDECTRFTLAPGDKYALDSEYFFHSLEARALDIDMLNQINDEEQRKAPRSPRRGTQKK